MVEPGHPVVTTRCKHHALLVDLQASDWSAAFVVIHGSEHLYVPELDKSILASRQDVSAIWGQGQRFYLPVVLFQHVDASLVPQIPQLDVGVITPTGQNVLVVGIDGKAAHLDRVPLQAVGY